MIHLVHLGKGLWEPSGNISPLRRLMRFFNKISKFGGRCFQLPWKTLKGLRYQWIARNSKRTRIRNRVQKARLIYYIQEKTMCDGFNMLSPW